MTSSNQATTRGGTHRMFSAIRKRMTFANVAMTLALVFAMTGGAYAAGKFLITSTKQIKPSVLKQLQGKVGANGAQGPAGAAGAQGPAGPAGAQGPAGLKGETGPEGKEGKEGIAGKDGKNGTTGFTETLPSGKTETGGWGGGPAPIEKSIGLLGSHALRFTISFSIPLAEAVPAEHAAVVLGGEEWNLKSFAHAAPANCLGSVAEPKAERGFLCFYVQKLEHNGVFPVPLVSTLDESGLGASKAGAIVEIVSGETNEPEPVIGYGSWAVTAE
jgi:Collagen triple helix repeat (20 copies)